MTNQPPTEPPSESPSFLDPVERILAEELEEFGGDWDRALEELSARHPEHAESIRWRIDVLRGSMWIGSGDDPATPVPADPEMPDAIGSYRPLSILGRGGMGVVYLAEQAEPVRRRVALKVMKPGMDHERMLTRFEVERRTLGLLNHSGVAKILDAGTATDGRLFFAMVYVDGVPLTSYCNEHRLEVRERLRLLREVCLAVHHAHQKGVIHRDLKPENLLVTQEEGRVLPKVIDFGLARIVQALDDDAQRFTEQGTLLGTPEYMSPEQARADGPDIDVRSDVYSLGVVMYELLTGHLPVEMDDARQRGVLAVQERITHSDPELPSRKLASAHDLERQTSLRSERVSSRYCRRIAGDLDWIAMRTLAKDPGERYPSAQGLADDLQSYLDGMPVAAGPPSTVYRLRKYAARHRTLVISAAVLLVSLVAGLAVSLGFYLDAEAARKDALQRAREADHATRLLVDLFAAANPYHSTGEAMPVGMLLQEGTLRLQRELPDDLGVKATLSQALGRIYLSLGSLDRADELLRAAGSGFDRVGADVRGRLENRLLTARLHLEREEAGVEEEFSALVEELRARADPEPRLLAGALAGLSRARSLRADYDGALEPMQDASQIYARLGDDSSFANTRGRCAGLLWELGRTADARREFEELLRLLAERYPEGHAQTAVTLREYADFLSSLGETEDAVVLAKRSVAMAVEIFGEKHLAYARTLLKCANVLLSAGRLTKAEQLLRSALQIYRNALGENHGEIAWTLNDLGMLYLKQARAADAEPLLARAQEIYQQAEHPFAPIAMANHGAALSDLGRLDEAEELIGEAIAWFEQESPRRIAPLGEARLKLARLFNQKGDLVGAVRTAREVIELVRDAPGHEWLLGRAWSTLAFARNLQGGRAEEAGAAAEKALGLLQSQQRTDDLEIALALWQLGSSHLARGDLASAEPPVRQAIAMLHRLFPDGHPVLVYPTLYLGARLPAARNEEAIALLEEAVRQCRAFLPPDSRFRLDALLALAQRLMAGERWQAAEPYVVEAWEAVQGRGPEDRHRSTANRLRQSLREQLGREPGDGGGDRGK